MPKKTRRLWLGLEVVSIPPKTPRVLLVDVLRESIRRGDYTLPPGYEINLRWRNSEKARMKVGQWQDELEKSAGSSDGFDLAVLDYLDKL